eukprot:10017116-Lingulodinium_polyedra.AAC.1
MGAENSLGAENNLGAGNDVGAENDLGAEDDLFVGAENSYLVQDHFEQGKPEAEVGPAVVGPAAGPA